MVLTEHPLPMIDSGKALAAFQKIKPNKRNRLNKIDLMSFPLYKTTSIITGFLSGGISPV